jgi:hypothetical protein
VWGEPAGSCLLPAACCCRLHLIAAGPARSGASCLHAMNFIRPSQPTCVCLHCRAHRGSWSEVKPAGGRPRARCCTALFAVEHRVLMFGGDTYGEHNHADAISSIRHSACLWTCLPPMHAQC